MRRSRLALLLAVILIAVSLLYCWWAFAWRVGLGDLRLVSSPKVREGFSEKDQYYPHGHFYWKTLEFILENRLGDDLEVLIAVELECDPSVGRWGMAYDRGGHSWIEGRKLLLDLIPYEQPNVVVIPAKGRRVVSLPDAAGFTPAEDGILPQGVYRIFAAVRLVRGGRDYWFEWEVASGLVSEMEPL